MSPSIPPGMQMRWAGATGARLSRRHLGDSHPEPTCLDDHFTGEFHSAGPQAHPKEGIFGEASKPAMLITARALEKEPRGPGQKWVADIAMQGSHSSRLDSPLESIAYHEVETLL